MGHYDNCRPEYCGACGAAPGNIINGVCTFCQKDKNNMTKKKTTVTQPKMITRYIAWSGDPLNDLIEAYESFEDVEAGCAEFFIEVKMPSTIEFNKPRKVATVTVGG